MTRGLAWIGQPERSGGRSPNCPKGAREAGRTRSGRVRIQLLLGSVVLLGGCLDCFDGGELEAAFREGEAQALWRNQAQFEQGYQDGLLLTYADGERDGAIEGYASGYASGYYGPDGYSSGHARGYADGHHDGSYDPHACHEGGIDGYAHGEYDGFHRGWSDGYAIGYDDGYLDGSYDGTSACEYAFARASRDEAQVCLERGYELRLDGTALERGFLAGKADNPEYTAGYLAQFDPSFAEGRVHGELDGYDNGLRDGYDSGWADGYDAVYYLCYDSAYQDGFGDGHERGWYEGLGVGYDDGYSAGFHDAIDQC